MRAAKRNDYIIKINAIKNELLIYWTGISILIFVSCKHTDRKQTVIYPIVCHTEDIPNGTKTMLLSELTDDVDIVRLETNDSCLIQRTMQVYISDNYIGTPDGTMNVSFKLFDRKGRFVTQIGSKGQGPHEYRGLYCAFIDEAAGRIYLAEFSNASKLLCYDLAGKHIENTPFYFKQLSKPQFMIKNDTVTVVSMPFPNPEMFLFQQNMKGELIQFVLPPADFDFDKTKYFDEEVHLTSNKGAFSFHYTALDTRCSGTMRNRINSFRNSVFRWTNKRRRILCTFRTLNGRIISLFSTG